MVKLRPGDDLIVVVKQFPPENLMFIRTEIVTSVCVCLGTWEFIIHIIVDWRINRETRDINYINIIDDFTEYLYN